jgi:prolyl-tRNA synthetase
MIRKMVSGVYGYMNMGWRTVRKIEQIVREEMDRSDATEILMSPLQSAELWRESGRWSVYGPEMWRVCDRHAREFCLGPTAEEVFTDIVRSEISSHKQLPINLYQIQTKYRDEARPRYGVMRAREFIMKDAYSFDKDQAGLDERYKIMYDAYDRVFTRCGLDFRAVWADNGAIGGSESQEFVALCAYGESDIMFCDSCDFAATTEQAVFVDDPASPDTEALEAIKEVHTPGTKTIEAVANYLAVPTAKTIKALLFVVYDEDEDLGRETTATDSGSKPAEADLGSNAAATDLGCKSADVNLGSSAAATNSDTGVGGPAADDASESPREPSADTCRVKEYVAAFVRGDRELNMTKLINALGIAEHRIAFADENAMSEVTGCVGGFTGPTGLHDCKMVVDSELTGLKNLCAGACKADHHLTGVNYGRDYKGDIVTDIKLVKEGDPCPECGKPLRTARGIEVGQVFKLGTKYSASMGATYRDENMQEQLILMGCYGIGVTRTMAAVVEQYHDDKGILWPMSVAPYHVIITLAKGDDEAARRVADEIYEKFLAAGVEVILDDRDERAGVKFNDADIFGIPIRITVGKKAADNIVEYKRRRDPKDATIELPPDEAIAKAIEAIAAETNK